MCSLPLIGRESGVGVSGQIAGGKAVLLLSSLLSKYVFTK